ncbi:hypothetical protein TNCV_3445431 [Trichonephila clavipes]|nr:hypothetical protein TNCV_3445431 [Trichonephila clavipes]
MQVLANREPFYKSIQRKAVVLFQKLKNFPNNSFSRNYDLNRTRNLRTQEGFIQSVMKVACSLELCQEISILPLPLCPLNYIRLDINLELHVKILNREMSLEQLKAIALEMIHNRFPTSKLLHVFTNGSLLERSVFG